jgi:predicted transcriptional regulator
LEENNLLNKLKELSLIFDKIQHSLTRTENLHKEINEVINNEEYKLSDEENNVINQLEEQAEEIYKSFNIIYNYK